MDTDITPDIVNAGKVQMAAYLFDALVRPERWFHRRHEAVTIIDAGRARRRVEVYLSIPQHVLAPPAEVNVPLAFVRRQRTRVVRLTDESGSELPVLTIHEAGELCTDVVELAARKTLRSTDEPLSEPLGALIRSTVVDKRPLSAVTPERVAATPGLDVLLGDDAFVRVWRLLARYEPVLVPVLSAVKSRRRFVVEYEVEAVRRASFWGRLVQSLGWRDTQMVLDVPDAILSGFYDFDFEAPEGLELTDAQLGDADGPSEHWSPGQFNRLSAVHRARDPSAVIRVSMRIARAYPANVLAAATFVALVLTAGLLRLHAFSAATDASAAILLAAPTLFIALIAGPARRSPAAELVVVARVVLVLSGLLAYVAALTLIMYPNPIGRESVDKTLHAIWEAACIASWGLVALQVLGLLGPLVQARSRRPPIRRSASAP